MKVLRYIPIFFIFVSLTYSEEIQAPKNTLNLPGESNVIVLKESSEIDRLEDEIYSQNKKINDIQKDINKFNKELEEVGKEKNSLSKEVRELNISLKKSKLEVNKVNNDIRKANLKLSLLGNKSDNQILTIEVGKEKNSYIKRSKRIKYIFKKIKT